jgi:tight adherence protein B
MNPKAVPPVAVDPNAGSEQIMLYIVAGVAVAAALAVFFFFRYLWELRTRRVQGRLADVRSADEPVLVRPRPATDGRARFDESFANLLQQTGLQLTTDQAVAWIFLVGCIVAVVCFFVSNELWPLPIGFMLGGIAVVVTFFIYRSIYRNRLQAQFPDAIAFLARALRSGLSLEQAILLVGKESPKPLADEFELCTGRIKLGAPIQSALEAMAQRMQLIDFNAFVSTIAVYQANGGNLPVLLDRLEASARDRANFRAFFRAATAMSRVSMIPLAFMVPIITIIYLVWQPGYVQGYLATPAAPLVIGGAVLVECLGLYWIYWLLRYDY